MTRRSVLSVEDSDTDFMALQCALKAVGVTTPLERLASGRAAMRWLDDAPSCKLEDRTSLVLLDLNLPGIDGLNLLKTARRRDPERHVPIIILTTSSHPRDIADSYEAGADAYMVKPLALEDWETKVGPLTDFWLKAVASRMGGSTETASIETNDDARVRDGLKRMIEVEIIPRLLLAHENGTRPKPPQSTSFSPGEQSIAQLARIAIERDVREIAAFVETVRSSEASIDAVFHQLIAPASRLVGDLWKTDGCSFAQFSGALARLQQVLVELSPEGEKQTRH